MPADDYTAAVSGGLKLKGVRSSGKVSKFHKKKRPKSFQPKSSADANAEKSKDGAMNDGEDVKDEHEDATKDEGIRALESEDATPLPQAGKTEAELRHEERRRKRVCYFQLLLLPAICTETLAENDPSARRAFEARRYQDAQGACGRTEPLPQQSE